MSPVHHASVFEAAITSSLIGSGWRRGVPEDYDRGLGLSPDDLVEFVRDTQPKEGERLVQLQSDDEASAARRLAEVWPGGSTTTVRSSGATRG